MKWIITSLLLFSLINIKAQELYNYSSNLPATDALGRKLPKYNEAGKLQKDKFVGLFYWTWHTQLVQNRKKPYNVTEILAEKPEAIHDFYDPKWPEERTPYYWV